jgi:hypothetical protein
VLYISQGRGLDGNNADKKLHHLYGVIMIKRVRVFQLNKSEIENGV